MSILEKQWMSILGNGNGNGKPVSASSRKKMLKL